MHVAYLHGVNSKAFKKYKEHLLVTALANHKEVREEFLEYIEALRSKKISNDEFEVHVSRLRECASIKIDKEKQHRYSVLFDETKKFFWKVVPSYYEDRVVSENKSVKELYRILSRIGYEKATSENESVKNLYRILRGIDYEKATLGEVLKTLGLLELVSDCNIELVYTR